VIFRFPESFERFPIEPTALTQAAFGCGGRRFLDRTHGQRRFFGDRFGERSRVFVKVITGDVVDDADFRRILRGDVLAGHREFLRDGGTGETADELDAAGTGENAQIDLRKTELRVLVGKAEVTGHSQFEPTAEAVPSNLGDYRGWVVNDILEDRPTPVSIPFRRSLELVDVGPGTEIPLGTIEDDGAEHAALVWFTPLEPPERGDDVLGELGAKSVQRVRAIQRHAADPEIGIEAADRRLERFFHNSKTEVRRVLFFRPAHRHRRHTVMDEPFR
jgi:hypothetical protein